MSLHEFECQLWGNNGCVRHVYSQVFTPIDTGVELRAALRWGGDNGRASGYPAFFITADGEALSFAAVRDNRSTAACRGRRPPDRVPVLGHG